MSFNSTLATTSGTAENVFSDIFSPNSPLPPHPYDDILGPHSLGLLDYLRYDTVSLPLEDILGEISDNIILSTIQLPTSFDPTDDVVSSIISLEN